MSTASLWNSKSAATKTDLLPQRLLQAACQMLFSHSKCKPQWVSIPSLNILSQYKVNFVLIVIGIEECERGVKRSLQEDFDNIIIR